MTPPTLCLNSYLQWPCLISLSGDVHHCQDGCPMSQPSQRFTLRPRFTWAAGRNSRSPWRTCKAFFFFPFLPPSPFLPAVSSPLPCPSSDLVGPYYTSSCAAGYRLFCTQDKLYQLPHKSRGQHDPDATRQGCPRPPFIQHICQLIHADTLGHSGSSHPLRFAPRCKEINLMLFVT